MYQAIEAICQNGVIQPLEPVVFNHNEYLVILRLPRPAMLPGSAIKGTMRGMLSSVDDFIAAKQQEIDRE
ncbi:antitoxin family protein [Thiospirillum jenense]|uniref:Antitoxin family protein n=1 Tax=Thiospirillum jenense TaxID=1653858 RepID=A0A839HAY3_9GAMM|nr:antitoxin family protein [Thiospirillum jenense]MBB1125911.1 antitoxin family protein [Thiospirillum jenense]